LREVVDADLLLLVVDISDDRWEHHINVVDHVLQDIGADKVPRVHVFNKSDRILPKERTVATKAMGLANSIVVSARKGTHVEQLAGLIDDSLNDSRTMDMLIPFTESKTIAWLHRFGDIRSKSYTEKGTIVRAVINAKDIATVKRFEIV